jgi:hypothetical protein
MGGYLSNTWDHDLVQVAEKNTLETSGEDAKLHSERVEKTRNYTRNEWKTQFLITAAAFKFMEEVMAVGAEAITLSKPLN